VIPALKQLIAAQMMPIPLRVAIASAVHVAAIASVTSVAISIDVR